MAFLDHVSNEVNLFFVYWGAASSGRSSCIELVRQEEYRPIRGRASRYHTDDWTTFDFLPRGLHAVGGRGVRIHLAAPPRGMWPAQVVERGDGKRVLAADSILFVADARPERMEDNRAALAWLFHIHAGNTTRVLQVHKRDLAPHVPIATYHELVAGSVAIVESSVVDGTGVYSAIKEALRPHLERIRSGELT